MKEEIITKLEKCGWFSEIGEEKSKILKEKIENGDEEMQLGVLSIADVDIDVECIDDFGSHDGEIIDSYTAILHALSEASDGVFLPTKIKDELDEEKNVVAVSFEFNGNVFSEELKYDNDWADPRIFDLVDKALESANIQQKFMALPYPDQVAYLTFITPKTYAKALEIGVFSGLGDF